MPQTYKEQEGNNDRRIAVAGREVKTRTCSCPWNTVKDRSQVRMFPLRKAGIWRRYTVAKIASAERVMALSTCLHPERTSSRATTELVACTHTVFYLQETPLSRSCRVEPIHHVLGDANISAGNRHRRCERWPSYRTYGAYSPLSARVTLTSEQVHRGRASVWHPEPRCAATSIVKIRFRPSSRRPDPAFEHCYTKAGMREFRRRGSVMH